MSEAHLDSLLSNTSSTLDLLAPLSTSFRAVEAQTTAFRKQCEELLSEQRRLTALADDLDHNLKYYSYLELITRRLNAPGAGTLVKGKEFSGILAHLDECLDYMATHVSKTVLMKILIDPGTVIPKRSTALSITLPPTYDEGFDIDPSILRRYLA